MENVRLDKIPLFPDTSMLSIRHKEAVDKYNDNSKYNGSGLNFNNIFILDTNNDTRISRLRNGFLISQTPINSSRPVALVVSNEHDSEIISEILNHYHSIELYPFSSPNAIPDVDNADYLYSVKETAGLSGKKYSAIRHKLNLFLKNPNIRFDKITKKQHQEAWGFMKKTTTEESTNHPGHADSIAVELASFEKIQVFQQHLKVSIFGLWINNILCGISVTEKIPARTLLIHVFRVNKSYRGISEYSFTLLARKHHTLNLINFEQDLGIPGLRQFKKSLRPMSLRMVYTLKCINSQKSSDKRKRH